MSTIANGSNRPLFDKSGTVPDVSGAMQDYYQNLVFEILKKQINGFLVEGNKHPDQFSGRHSALKRSAINA